MSGLVSSGSLLVSSGLVSVVCAVLLVSGSGLVSGASVVFVFSSLEWVRFWLGSACFSGSSFSEFAGLDILFLLLGS